MAWSVCCRQVCHRDLKLENVMLKEPGSLQIKITDFGFSKDFGNESLPKTKRIGTLAYMAPEVASCLLYTSPSPRDRG